MTQLPPPDPKLEEYFNEVEKKAGTILPKKEEKPDIMHNWLYSVVPSFGGVQGIYLAGYCKQCRNAFTVRLPEDALVGFVRIEHMDVPVWGCEPVRPTTA